MRFSKKKKKKKTKESGGVVKFICNFSFIYDVIKFCNYYSQVKNSYLHTQIIRKGRKNCAQKDKVGLNE